MAGGAGPDASSRSRVRRHIPGTIRPYRPGDREAIRDICRRTAYRNRGSQSIFEDGEVFADYWTKYYTDLEPESCLVVEEDGKVVGYLLGCIDSRRFVRSMAQTILPRLLLRMFGRLLAFQYKQRTTRRAILWFVLHSWREGPGVPIERYPAHFHCNLLREGYGKSYFSRLATAFVERAELLGTEALHLQVSEAPDGGPWRKLGLTSPNADRLEFFAEKTSSFHRVVLGQEGEMVNRAWGFRTHDARVWLAWIQEKHRL